MAFLGSFSVHDFEERLEAKENAGWEFDIF
jgi:hypothetical protein